MQFVAVCVLLALTAVAASDRTVVGGDVRSDGSLLFALPSSDSRCCAFCRSASFQGQSGKMTIWNTKAGAESNINIGYSLRSLRVCGPDSVS